MNKQRLDSIRAMLERNSDDVFLNYSLGMELAAGGMHVQAVDAFDKCIGLDADYLPAYVEKGRSHRSAGNIEAARQTFAAAMELAAMQGQPHVRDFIQQQLDSLPPA